VSNWTNPYYESTSSEEQQIYQHLLKLLESQSPSQMIERFRALFIEGADYPETEILLLLDKIVASNNRTRFQILPQSLLPYFNQ
jgi:hypothetical protein